MNPFLGLAAALALSSSEVVPGHDSFYGHTRRTTPDRPRLTPAQTKTKAKRTTRQRAAKRARKTNRRTGS